MAIIYLGRDGTGHSLDDETGRMVAWAQTPAGLLRGLRDLAIREPAQDYQSPQGFSGKRMGHSGDGAYSGLARGSGPQGTGQ